MSGAADCGWLGLRLEIDTTNGQNFQAKELGLEPYRAKQILQTFKG